MSQPSLFSGGIPAMRLSHALQRVERKRLSRQCSVMLFRLRLGDATNDALAQIALKYTSRISDLREAGYDIRVVERDHTTGRVTYRLVAEP